MAKYQSLDELDNESNRCFSWNCLFLFVLILSILAGYVYLIRKDIGHVSHLFFKQSSEERFAPSMSDDQEVGSISTTSSTSSILSQHNRVPSSLYSHASLVHPYHHPANSNCQCNCSVLSIHSSSRHHLPKVSNTWTNAYQAHPVQAPASISSSQIYARDPYHLVNGHSVIQNRHHVTQSRQYEQWKKQLQDRSTGRKGDSRILASWFSNISYHPYKFSKTKPYPNDRPNDRPKLNKPAWVRNLK